jgi:ABC-type transport system substrate-binding protein
LVQSLATSYEISGDRTQVTFKIRPGMKWDSRAPTSGRPIDTADILFSWDKYSSLNASAADLVYNAETSPGAPIDSIEAPDDQTIVMKLKQFDSSLIQLFAAWDHFYIMPRESDGGFNPETEIRGHGPWILDEYVPSASVRWKRNPDYYIENRPFPEFLERPIVSDYAQQLAQFRAGNIWTWVANPEDVVQLKRDAPDSIIQENATFGTSVSPFITFCWDGPPFTDSRMRRALSLLIDSEAFADVVENRDGYAAEGLDLQIARNTIVAPGQVGYWIDPEDPAEFGENAKWLGFDIEEAKKLIEASGYTDGVSFPVHYNSENTYGPAYHQLLDIFEGMLAEGGMTLERDGQPYAFYRSEIYDFYLKEKYANRSMDLTGIIHRATRGFPTVAAGLFGMMHPNGGFYHGAAPDGGNVADGDPDMIAMIEKVKAEPDMEEQQAQVKELIRYITGQMYNVPRPTNAKLFRNWWPAIGNVGLNNTYAGGNIWVEERINWWVDESAPGAS